jgi:S-(hydroxymethyl)glutathione dehydrogenase / alcohol dehydrogenase
MSTPARVAVMPAGSSQLEVVAVDLPEPGPYEVLVEQFATGICHSQLDQMAAADPAKPLLLGHESSGVVRAVGEKVEHVEVGDEVLITWVARNRKRAPQPVRVSFGDGSEAVTRNVYTWATHALADEQYVVKVEKGLPGDLVSIVGCAVMTGAGAVINSAAPAHGAAVAVWGVGGIGLSAVAAARNAGASPVIAVDISDVKLQLASRMGADKLVNAAEVDPVAEIRRLTAGGDVEGVDYSIDCTGLAGNLAKSVAATRPGVLGLTTGGSTVLVGAIRTSFELPGMELINGQKRLVGCFGGECRPERDFPIFLDWFTQGRLDLGALVTDRYTLDEISRGVEDLRNGRIVGRAIVEF